MLGENRIHDLFDFRSLLFGDEPVVGRNRGFLRLDQSALNGIDLLVQPRFHLIEQRLKLNTFLALNGALLRAPDIKAVAASDDQIIEAHELLHHLAVATANYAYRAPLS